MLVPNIHWIIIEDAVETSKLVQSLLNRAGLTTRSTLLNSKTPDDFKLKAKVCQFFVLYVFVSPFSPKPKSFPPFTISTATATASSKSVVNYGSELIMFMQNAETV